MIRVGKRIGFVMDRMFILLILVFSFLRIYVGSNLGLWFFIGSIDDDLLLLNYSDLSNHFLNWNILTLTKDISYSLFLFFVNISNIPYSFYLSLLWIVAGILITYSIYKFLNKDKLLLLLVFLFIIFLPVAFDSSCGTRIYRNAIMAPLIIILLSVLLIFVLNSLSKVTNYTKLVFLSIVVGLIFSFNFYIKEDGILTLPLLLVCITSIILFHFYEFRKKFDIKYILIMLIPLLIFGASTISYKEVNNYYFGVDEINTRTDGEIGEFWNMLLKIDDPNKTTEIWVPVSTIEKAWNASPTLQSRPDLFENLIHSDWAGGDLNQNPLPGDLVALCLRDELKDVNLFNNEKQANDFFNQVNSELEDAFASGKLNKSDRIFITSSATGKTLDEVFGLKPYITSAVKSCVFYKDLLIEDYPIPGSSQLVSNEVTSNTESILNEKLVTQENMNNPTFGEYISLELMKLDIKIYQTISYVIFILSALSFIFILFSQFKNKFKNRQLNAILGFECLLAITFILEIFAIGWFCSWMGTNSMKFYTVANHGIFAVFEVISICTALKIFLEKYQNGTVH